MLTLYFRGHNSSPWSVPQCATLFLHPGSCICLASSVEFPWAMYSHRTQQMNTSCLNKEVCKIIVSREPSVVVRHPHILYRQDRYELSKDSKFKNSGLLGTTEFRKGGTYFIYQSIRGNIPEYLNTQQHAVRISHVHRPLTCWDRGFESHRGHGYFSVVSVVCCQVEVFATSWSLVQRSPTDCGASLCVI